MDKYVLAGEITQDSVSPFKDFLNEHNQEGESVEIEISSPGGEVFAGLSMAEAMRNFKGAISVKIGTYAASMAGVLALLADDLTVGMNSFLMLHAPIVAPGYVNANEMRDMIAQLDKAQETLTSYVKEKVSDVRVDEWMSSYCTWFNAEDMEEIFGATISGSEPVVLNKLDLEKVSLPTDIEAKFGKPAEDELHDEPAPQDTITDVPDPEPEPEPEPQDIVPPALENDADALTALEALRNELKELGIE